MADEGRPNPITKAAEASTLPRQARARIGQTTDPMPEGKVLDAAPELHFPLEAATHDADRNVSQPFGDMTVAERTAHVKEMTQAHDANSMKHADMGNQQGKYMGTGTVANKRMESRHQGFTSG